jgi:hypothetical protein
MGRNPKQGPALVTGLPNAVQVAVLEVADASVDYLKAVGRSSVGKVLLFDDGGGKTAQRCVPGGAYPKYAAPDDDYVIFSIY